MAGMHHTKEPRASTSTASDIQTDRIAESLKDLSISNCSKNKKKGGGTKKKKQTTNTYKTREKEIPRPLSQISYRSKKYNLPFQKSDDTTITKSSVNRLSSSDPSGDALLRKSLSGDQFRGLRHSSSSSPSQSSETARFGAVRRKGRRGSDSCPESGYLLPYGLRVQHAAHKCMWSGSESGSATSPAGSSSQPSGECIAEAVATSKIPVPSDSRKGSESHFPGAAQRKINKASRKEFKFEAYMPLCEVQQSLKKGELIEGILRINPRNYEDAYISAPDGQMDIYIGGIHDRNRALHGDVIAVQLKEPADWKVVHILEKKHTRMAAGSLKLLQDGNSNWALFSPTDHKLPRIFIPIRECPPDFLKRSKDFCNYLFLAKVVDWTEDSKFAKGTLIQKLGEAGEIDAETSGILLENGIDTKDFDEDALKDLPQESTWNIPHDEIKNRRDFREECVFTIDPATARDLDDAVSCNKLEDGKTFEIGVHIADVTYFVKDGTALDSIASERATSVYLVQNVVPMLPHVLCEKLCSLNPGEDRLSFSVVWKVTAEGEIIEEWFGRSIICSCVKLSYEDAQIMIENPQKELDPNTFPHINGKFVFKDIMERVVNLNSVAQKLRQKRFKDGALRLDQVKLQFCLDKESGMPSGFSIYEHRDSNRLIEEFMLLANMAVAHKIYKSFPDQALLRCHPSPEQKLMNDVVTTCQAMGIKLDASTSGTLQASLAVLAGDDLYSKARCQILTSLCSKPMKCAQYFSSGSIKEPTDCHHYALNVPLYTHFTSPIRRYPDIIVHRLLAASLDNTTATYASKSLQKLANHCNDKKYTAKRVNELSSELFLVAFIRECGPLDDQAMVMGVMDHSFDVLILSIGLVKRIYCDKLNLKSKHYQKEKGIPQLFLHWNQRNEFIQKIKVFTLVDVTLSVQQSDPMKINVILRYPDDL